MVIVCWSVKGGVGVTAVSAALGLSWSRSDRRGPSPVLLVDLAGDLPTCLGLPDPGGPGVAEWLGTGDGAPPDALSRLALPVADGIELLPRGRGPLPVERAGLLLQLLGTGGTTVIVDAGRPAPGSAAARLAAEADRSLLVVRPCLLGLRRAAVAPIRPSGVVVVREPGRALTSADVAAAVGAPVVAEVVVDPAVSRAIDAGLLRARLPRGHLDALRAAA